MFPKLDVKINKENPQIQTYGQRLYRDQTVYEYLLEFLLIFSSPKIDQHEGAFSFVLPEEGRESQVKYYPAPRMGLKRFIFIEHSPKDKRFRVDVDAYEAHLHDLSKRIQNDSNQWTDGFILSSIQDLFYGFRAITKSRSWFAQSMLPVTPELVFCEAIGRKNKRKKLKYEPGDGTVDSQFNFHDRVFMARGGEVYYLHVLQGLRKNIEQKPILEENLKELLNQFEGFSVLANLINDSWMDLQHDPQDVNEEGIGFITTTCKWIPDGYSERAEYTCLELTNLLAARIDFTKKIHILSSLVILQVLRMMCDQAQRSLNATSRIQWVTDVGGKKSSTVKQYSIESYRLCEENLFSAVHSASIEDYLKEAKRTRLSALNDAAKDTSKLFRRLTKAIGYVIPPKGRNTRFGMNEHIVDILVTALIKPGEKILLSTFLLRCYSHFGIVIGPREATDYFAASDTDLTDFDHNEEQFQELLRNCGYLRSLSDATSIVENPFGGSKS